MLILSPIFSSIEALVAMVLKYLKILKLTLDYSEELYAAFLGLLSVT